MTGKRKYLTREAAAHDMGLLARTRNTSNLCAYRCESCMEYHVGHTPKRVMLRFGLV